MSTPLVIAITSTALQLVGYSVYNRSLWTGRIRPNLSSWIVWTGISVLNTSSYFFLTGHDLVVSLLPVSITLVNVITLAGMLHRGWFQSIGRPDIVALVISGVATVAWLVSKSPSLANLMVQAAIIVGTVPTVLGVWRNPTFERSLPWFLWSGSFVFALIVVSLRDVSWVAYASPIIQFTLYVTIGALTYRKPAIA